MSINIYHGSEIIVRQPRFGAGRAYNDFGLGFYCTEYREHAAEWAVSSGRNGFVSAYSLDTSGLRVINLCGPQYTALHWIYILLNYREFDIPSRMLQPAFRKGLSRGQDVLPEHELVPEEQQCQPRVRSEKQPRLRSHHFCRPRACSLPRQLSSRRCA